MRGGVHAACVCMCVGGVSHMLGVLELPGEGLHPSGHSRGLDSSLVLASEAELTTQ